MAIRSSVRAPFLNREESNSLLLDPQTHRTFAVLPLVSIRRVRFGSRPPRMNEMR